VTGGTLPISSMHVVATAGHVDHGKSALVRALTGVDPDRFAEEKRRGLTIDLGFAWMTLPAAGAVEFVDVPGHIRFISNMLAGVAVIEAGLLCVDAREGWRAQTEDHLRILDLIGLPAGMVAITKAGLVDSGRIASVREEVTQRTTDTVLASAPVVACDAIEGSGLDELRQRLDAMLTARPPVADRGLARLWVDRSFPIAGAGTVVTGGIAHGAFAVGDRVVVVGADGKGLDARIRSIQALGRPVERAPAGTRAALNVAGVHHRAIRRGDAVVHPHRWHTTQRVAATLDVLASLDHKVTQRGAYLAYLGTGEHAVRLRLLDAAGLAPGTSGRVRLSFPRALPLLPGDRYVLRETGRGELVGGGQLIDVSPASRPRAADATSARWCGDDPARQRHDAARTAPAEPLSTGHDHLGGPPHDQARSASAAQLSVEHDWIRADELERRLGIAVEPVIGDWFVSPETLRTTREALLAHLDGARPVGLDIARLDEREQAVLARLEREGLAERVAGYAVAPAWCDELARHPFVTRLEGHLFSPPPPVPGEVAPDVLRALVRRGYVVARDGIYFAGSAQTAATRVLAALSRRHPDGFTVSQARQALGTTRKWALPLLQLLDEAGVTVRHGDHRTIRRQAPPADS
jgi:selenocysteine-specific elongation factor